MAADLDGALWEDALAGGGLAYIQRAAVERQVTQEEGGVGGGMDGGRVMGYNFPTSRTGNVLTPEVLWNGGLPAGSGSGNASHVSAYRRGGDRGGRQRDCLSS